MEIILGFGDRATSMAERNKRQAMSTLLIIVAVYFTTWMLSIVLFIITNSMGIYQCFPCSELAAITGSSKLMIIGGACSAIVLELAFVINPLLHLWRSKDYRRAMLRATKVRVTWVAPVIKITGSNGDELPHYSQ